MKIFAIVLISILAAILAALCVVTIIGHTCFNIAMSSKSVIKKLAKTNTKNNFETYKIDRSWWDKQNIKDEEIVSHDGLKLCGHFIEQEGSNNLAILVHGYGGEYKDLSSYAQLFMRRGYNILAVECRAHGNSEGDMVGMGWLDRLDIKAWIEYMLTKSNYKIVLFGQSMGASAVCMTLGEDIPNNVVCAVADCGFDNVYRQIYHVCQGRLKILAKPTMKIFNGYMKRAKNFDLKHADAVKQLKKSKIPVLFIHGKADDFVPVEMCYHLADAIPENRRETLLVENAGHIMSYAVDTKGYINKVNKFLDKYKM